MEHLIREGQELRATLAAEKAAPEQMRLWQRECGAAIGQLSGGNKAHWLSRAYSEAYLPAGATEKSLAEIVQRIQGVLEQALASLKHANQDDRRDTPAAPSRRFDFVHEKALRPSLEQTYAESRRALEAGDFALALVAACSVLEAVVTDALQRASGATLGDWTLEARAACAEQAGLISKGWARLPDAARRYRALLDARGDLRKDVSVSESDARLAGQVLHVVLRDLEPGR